MSLRVRRLALGPLPSGDVSFDEAIDQAPAETSLLHHIRQKFLSDETLVEALQDGDADALTVLFERHGPRLLGVALRILRNDAEAEDAVQQTFFDVFRSIEKFDPSKGSFKTWLFMFGYQRIFNCRRSLSVNRSFDTDSFDELLIEHHPDSGSSGRLSSADTAILIEQILKCIQPRQRRTIELVYYEGLTAEEIATRTGETVRVVRHNLYRALEKLRKTVMSRSQSDHPSSEKGER
jgi:RNA polymerase sigma-70 factor, ECF subfamily